jgi:mono/diheme cytochrome c family protein
MKACRRAKFHYHHLEIEGRPSGRLSERQYLTNEEACMSHVVKIATFTVFLAVLPLSVTAHGSADSGTGDPTRGKKIFGKYCSGCHGAQGQGDGYPLLGPSPANLLSPSTKGKSNDELLRTMHEGKPNMPAWNYRLSPKDSTDVLAYVRILQAERTE